MGTEIRRPDKKSEWGEGKGGKRDGKCIGRYIGERERRESRGRRERKGTWNRYCTLSLRRTSERERECIQQGNKQG